MMILLPHFILLTCLSITIEGHFQGNFPSWHWQYQVQKPKPNIIVIMADDLGFHDVSWHGSDQIPTPNIDALAIHGIGFKRHYVPPMCTPSRSALMTGKYPIHTGMQHFVIPSDEPWGLPLEEKILPQYLKEAGYTTSLIGKWHLGMFKRNYNPYKRGFDKYKGYLGPYVDYYDHSLKMLGKYSRGYDMRWNETLYYDTRGQYATDIFSKWSVDEIKNHDKKTPLFLLINHLAPHAGNEDFPLQAPQDLIDKFNYIKNTRRRTYAAMVHSLDVAVGKIMTALRESGMLDNSVVLFYSDNGAPTIGQHANDGSNYPMRGHKDSPWEGAVRTVSAVFSPLLINRQYVSNNLYHISDWVPTFINLAGGSMNLSTPNIAGIDIWNSLSYNVPSFRRDIVHNIDDIYGYASYEKDGYKYVEGIRLQTPAADSWLGEIPLDAIDNSPKLDYPQLIKNSETAKALQDYVQCSPGFSGRACKLSDEFILSFRQQSKLVCSVPKNGTYTPCIPSPTSQCLFDIINDPCEYRNLADLFPLRTAYMKLSVDAIRKTAVAPRNKPGDPNCDPVNYNLTWTWWQDANIL